MDYKEQIEQAKHAAEKWREKHRIVGVGEFRVDCMVDDLTRSITDLLARAEASEARVKKLAEAIEREQRRAEKAEKERDAAVSDLETVMAYGGGNLDTCQFCKNGQCYVRGGTKLCLPKWRGKKED